MKKQLGVIVRLIGLVPAAALILALLLTLCYCVPLDEINYIYSVEELGKEGWYPDVLELRPAYEDYFFSFQPGIQPTGNDMMDYERAGGDPGKSPIVNAMDMRGYARYWHGYAGVLRLLLLFFDCKEIKFLSFIFQIALVFFVAYRIREKCGRIMGLLFLSQYMLLMPLVVSVSMVFAFSIDLSLIAILVYMQFPNAFEQRPELKWVLFCGLGILTCFFEELVFGMMTWGIACLWILILAGKEHTGKENVSFTIRSGLAWIWGYGGIWFMKWILATLILGENIIADGIQSVLTRSSDNRGGINDTAGWGRILERYEAISENYKHYFYPVFFVILALWVIYLTYRFLRYEHKSDTRVPALALVVLGHIVWYFTLANHTSIHRFMTYRIYNPGIIVVLAILLLSVTVSQERTGDHKRKTWIRKAVLIGCSILLAGLMASGKTIGLENKNVTIPGEDVSFEQFASGSARMEFIPEGRKIKTLGVAICPDNAEGNYVFRLFSGEKAVHVKTIPAELFAEGAWQVIDLNWGVHAGQKYILEIVPEGKEDSAGTVSIEFLQDEPETKDFGNVEGLTGTPYTQITYWISYGVAVTGRNWVFYFLTWFAVFVSIGLLFWNKEKTE